MNQHVPLNVLWNNPWVRLATYVVAVIAAVGLVWYFSTLLTAFAAAFLLAYICDPIIDRLENLGVRRSLGILILILALALLLALLLLIVFPGVAQEMGRVGQRTNDYAQRVTQDVVPWIEDTFSVELPHSYSEFTDRLLADEQRLGWLAQKLRQPATAALSKVFSSLSSVAVSLLWLVVIPVAWVYLLKDIDSLIQRCRSMLPARHKQTIVDHLRRIDEALGNFLRGQLMVCALLAVLYAVGLKWIAQVPLGGTIGIIAGLISFVPYLGLVLGIIPALLLAWLEHGDLLHPALVCAVFVVVQLAEGNFITPKIVGEKLGLHPVLVIFSIMVWGQVLGFLGILLALPITAVLKVFWEDFVKWYSDQYLSAAGGDADG
ncbi:MAG: AI-2E family transporter [Candidatus Alcyoniella australis]|nr:AI-2E family transporter [Candidatus Alcyoniella australis]